MNSLRLRLILGVALVALVPLALGMTLLSNRIEQTVRAQAAERLDAALGALQQQLAVDGARIAGQLQILGRDPSLKRLYLLRPAGDRDLPDFLAERRFLLGLDFLSVVDTGGALVADAATPSTAARADEDAWRETAARWGADEREATEGLGDAALVLGARAPIQYEGVPAGSLIGGRALDAALLAQLRQTSGVDLVLRDASGRMVATSFGDSAAIPAAPETGVRHVERAGRSYLSRSRQLAIGPVARATITGMVPTTAADQTIAALQWTSVLLGGLGLAIAILLGIVWSSQISRPVERLAAYSDRLARGEWDEPLRLKSVRELETLVSALDRMRTDLKGYRERLVVGERHAAWSLMARKVAHEVKNPLTPIAISVADLRRSYEMQRPDFPEILDQATRTIAQEVETLKQLLNEFSEFGRLPAPRFERCNLADLLAGVEALYARDITEGRLSVSSPARDGQLKADAGQLRQALVNLIKNGLEATGGVGRVTVATKAEPTALEITVADTGAGLDAEQRERLFVPGFTTKSHGSGLGLTIVERIVSDHHGTISVDSAPGRGTTFRIRLPLEQPAAPADSVTPASAAAPEARA